MKIKVVSLLIAIVFLFGCTGPAKTTEQSSAITSTVASESRETVSGTSPGTDGTTPQSEATNTVTGTTGSVPASAESSFPVVKTTKPAVSTAPQTNAPDGTVQLYINCINAVNDGIRSKPGYDEIIPSDGVLLDTAAKIREKDTVLSLLKRVLSENGISLNNQRGYIKGVGGLNDYVCGSSSGWLYSVNGVFPNYSSDQYVLKSGDKIKLLYSVNSGDVVDLSAWK